MWVALYRFGVLSLLVAILALLVLHTGDLATEVRLVQTSVARIEAAGLQRAAAVAAINGRVAQLEQSLTGQEESLKVLRRDADRVAEQGKAIEALRGQLVAQAEQGKAIEALQERLAAQAELGQALQRRTEDLTTTAADLTRMVQGLAEQVARPQLPTFPFPLPIPLAP